MSVFLLLFWTIRTLGSLSSLTYYWQLKEYRWDRMSEFLLRQGGFGKVFTSFHVALLLGLAMAFFLESQLYTALVTIVFLADSLRFFHRALQRKLKRPRPTGKALLIAGASSLTWVVLLTILLLVRDLLASPSQLAVVLSLFALFEMDLHAIFVWIANLLSGLVKKRRYLAAAAKRKSMSQLRVVGITGSYGKSSVKEYLTHILEEDFRVLKTAKNTNTEIGIAQTILEKLRDDHEIFVCEMGAYAEGEIAICCQMARPNIGIFTGLNEQHVSLFGSIDKTFSAKWELLESLPADGVGIFNGESEPLVKRLKPFRGKTLVCSTSKGGDAIAKQIEVSSDSIRFRYDEQLYTAPLVGAFQVVNLLMAITAAEQLGMSPRRIAERVKSIVPPEKTMTLQTFDRGTLIDDSYNVNPDGLRAALKHLQTFEEAQKVLFFPGIQELGEVSDRIHAQLAEEIASSVDWAFFHDPTTADFLSHEARKSGLGSTHICTSTDPTEMITRLEEIFQQHPKSSFVVLFESRGAEKVFEALK